MEQLVLVCKVCNTISPYPGPCLVHVAAPDLLEACEAAEHGIAAMGPVLRAAIAKAQGGKEQLRGNPTAWWPEWTMTPPHGQTIKGEAGGSESTT